MSLPNPVLPPDPFVTPPSDPSTGDLTTSLVRTVLPLLVGMLVAWLTRHGLHVSAEVVTAVVSFVYYLAVRLLEHFVSPKLGWLLGAAKAPVYQAAA